MSAVPKHAKDVDDTLLGEDSMNPPGEAIYISPWAYVRAMLVIAWSAFRHPLCRTTVDLETGECVHGL